MQRTSPARRADVVLRLALGTPMPSRVLVALRVAATPERAFAGSTDEIGQSWRPNGLFQLTPAGPGLLLFEPGPNGRLVVRQAGGREYEPGRISLWHPRSELAFQWRPADFSPEQMTESNPLRAAR